METSFLEKHPLFKDYLEPGSTVKDCGYPWDRIDVTNTGEVLPCCFAQETLGNVTQIGLDGVLEGPRRLALQQDVAAGRLSPLCFNAPCPFSRNTMASEWTTFFPADRFAPHLGEWQNSEIVYRPARGNGLIFGGPYRFLPTAKMQAEFVFSGNFKLGSSRVAQALVTGHVILEVADATGHVHALTDVPAIEIESAPALRFRLDGYHRQRCEFRASAAGVNFSLLFKGVRLSGSPA
jgi:Iron-sulfur cluster-binding domain